MKKRGISKVLVVIFLIILVIAMIILLWNLLKNLLKQQGEIAEAKAELVDMSVNIDDINISEYGKTTINITISRGAGRLVLKNVTIIYEPKYADVFSIVDLSGSMGGNKLNSAKEANKVFINNILSNSSNNRAGLVGYSDGVKEGDCHYLTKVYSSLNSTINNWNAQNMTCICCGINNATARILADWKEDKFKAIVVMSDGQANQLCSQQGTRNAKKDAIQAAADAYSHGIKVYAIGFGDPTSPGSLDNDTLKNISEAGHGTYSYADTASLVAIYTQVSQKIIEEYEVEKYDHLKIIFYSANASCEEKIPLPKRNESLPLPLETKTYELKKCLENVTRVEIYPVVYTPSGIQVIGQKLDSWIVS